MRSPSRRSSPTFGQFSLGGPVRRLRRGEEVPEVEADLSTICAGGTLGATILLLNVECRVRPAVVCRRRQPARLPRHPHLLVAPRLVAAVEVVLARPVAADLHGQRGRQRLRTCRANYWRVFEEQIRCRRRADSPTDAPCVKDLVVRGRRRRRDRVPSWFRVTGVFRCSTDASLRDGVRRGDRSGSGCGAGAATASSRRRRPRRRSAASQLRVGLRALNTGSTTSARHAILPPSTTCTVLDDDLSLSRGPRRRRPRRRPPCLRRARRAGRARRSVPRRGTRRSSGRHRPAARDERARRRLTPTLWGTGARRARAGHACGVCAHRVTTTRKLERHSRAPVDRGKPASVLTLRHPSAPFRGRKPRPGKNSPQTPANLTRMPSDFVTSTRYWPASESLIRRYANFGLGSD